MSLLRRAMSSSVVVRNVRRLAAGSAVCAAVAAVIRWPNVTQWLRQTRQRIAVGLGGEWSEQQEIRTVEQLDALVSNSRIAAALSALVMAPIVASREAGLRRVLDRFLSLDSLTKVRTGSCAIIIAVLCHIALLALLGVPVHALSWSISTGLVAAGLVVVWRPDTLVSAWKDKFE